MSRFSFSLGSWKLPFEDQAIGLAIERRKEKESEDSADFHVAKPKERKLVFNDNMLQEILVFNLKTESLITTLSKLLT